MTTATFSQSGITVSSPPTENNHLTTKQYVDDTTASTAQGTRADALNLFTIAYNGTSFPARSTAPSGCTVLWVNAVNSDEPSDSAIGDLMIKATL
jgi:hypothetical protein